MGVNLWASRMKRGVRIGEKEAKLQKRVPRLSFKTYSD